MAISIRVEPDHSLLVLNVAKRSLLPGRRLDRIVDGLFEALAIIRNRLEESEFAYFGLDVARSHRKGREFTPASVETALVWKELGEEKHLHDRLKAWLADLADLYVFARGEYEELFESETYQLGELGASLLAMSDIAFVPGYARLVALFDPGHNVHCDETIDEILEAHGFCAETEELLIAWSVDFERAPLLRQLLPQLEHHYGDFVASSLFERMVTALYKKDKVEWNAAYPSRPYVFEASFGNSALDESAKHIVAKLEATGDSGLHNG